MQWVIDKDSNQPTSLLSSLKNYKMGRSLLQIKQNHLVAWVAVVRRTSLQMSELEKLCCCSSSEGNCWMWKGRSCCCDSVWGWPNTFHLKEDSFPDKMELPRGWTKRFLWTAASGWMHQKTVGMFLAVLLLMMGIVESRELLNLFPEDEKNFLYQA